MLCMRLGVSIVGTCEIGLAQLGQNHGPGQVAELDGGVIVGAGGRRNGIEYPYLDTMRAGKAAARR